MSDASGLSADEPYVVIVGSGVAGALLADRLSRAGIRVLILEAGKQITRSEAVSLYRDSWRRDPQSAYERQSHASYPDRNAPDRYLSIKGEATYWCDYLRLVGGTTWHWGGTTPRFLPMDFELRSRYGVGRDWPLTYSEIEPYYLQAEQELGVSGDSIDDHGSPRSGPYPMPATPMLYSDQVIARYLKQHNIRVKVLPAARNSHIYRGRPACCGNNSCIPICPSGAKYSANIHINNAIQHGAHLIDNSVAYAVHVNSSGQVESINYKSPDGQSHTIKGRYYVLACNAIETPKLLLISRSENTPDGVANYSGLVGRCLMDHPTVAKAFLMSEPIYTGRGPQVVSALDHGRDGAFRSQHAAGQCILSMFAPDIQSYVTSLIEEEKDWESIDNRLEYFATHHGHISVLLEQLPDTENRIKPSNSEFDAIGIAKPEIYMKLDSYLVNAADYFNNFLNEIIGFLMANKISDFEFGNLWASHPMGTTCMGDNSKMSIVDRNCRSHDHPNLFIAGSSVFPTGGTANPTLTIAALSLRLADYMKSVIQTENL